MVGPKMGPLKPLPNITEVKQGGLQDGPPESPRTSRHLTSVCVNGIKEKRFPYIPTPSAPGKAAMKKMHTSTNARNLKKECFRNQIYRFKQERWYWHGNTSHVFTERNQLLIPYKSTVIRLRSPSSDRS